MNMAKKKESKIEAQKKIDTFFQRTSFTSEELRKIWNIAKAHRIRLGIYRKRFCQACWNPLAGTISINKGFKTTICASCGKKNRNKL
jgi:RNase P subunit RPR2